MIVIGDMLYSSFVPGANGCGDVGSYEEVDKLIIFLPFAVCKVVREVSTEEKVTSFSEPRS